MFKDNIIEILKLLDESSLPDLEPDEKNILDLRDSALFRYKLSLTYQLCTLFMLSNHLTIFQVDKIHALISKKSLLFLSKSRHHK